MLKFFAGFVTATIIGIGLLASPDTEFLSDTKPQKKHDILQQLSNYKGILSHYKLGLSAYFLGDVAYYPDFGPFRIVHLEPTQEITPSDIKEICFSAIDQDDNGNISTLQTSILLTDGASAQFQDMLEKYNGKELSFEVGPFKISNFSTTTTSIKEHKESRNYNFSTDTNIVRNPADFGLNTNDNVPALLHVISALSPDTIPSGCRPSFDTTNIKQWNELTAAFWGSKKRFL